MARKSTAYIVSRLAMAAGGVALFFIVPRDPWPVAMVAYLVVCSIVGSCLGRSLVRDSFVLAFLLAWALTAIIFFSTALLLELGRAGRSMVLQWWTMAAFFASLYSLAGTLCAFPAVELIAERVREGTPR